MLAFSCTEPAYFHAFLPEALLAYGYCHRLCVCVYRCVCQLLVVGTISHHTFQLESPDMDEKMQNILLKVPIVMGADWAWPSMSNYLPFKILFICITFVSLKYLWDVQKRSLLNYSTSHTFWFLYMHADRVVPWTVKQSSNKSLWDRRSPLPYLFGSHSLRSTLFLVRLSTHASPSLFHIITSFVPTSPITMLTNRLCHGPWRGLGDSAL